VDTYAVEQLLDVRLAGRRKKAAHFFESGREFMKTSGPPASDFGGSDFRLIDSFSLELKEFFRFFQPTPLFNKCPSKETSEAALLLLDNGSSLLSPLEYQFSKEACEKAASSLLALLKNHLPDRKPDLSRLEEILLKRKWTPENFLADVFTNREERIAYAIQKFDLEEDITMYFAVTLARPFKAQSARYLAEDLNLGNWSRGYCPVCGHWPSLAHIYSDGGQRTLWCMHCDTRWPFPRLQCSYCLNDNQDELELISPESDSPFRMQVCTGCRRYLKEVRSSEPADKFSFDEIYLKTHALDFLAQEEGYTHPSPLLVRNEGSDDENTGKSRRSSVHGQNDNWASLTNNCHFIP